jgi:metal-responsive CopG/Arc/MetJ family transcriptional regulator
MEEIQIKEFVHRVCNEESLRNELAENFDAVIEKEGFSSRVAGVLRRLTPQLLAQEGQEVSPALSWWNV